jgi:hypothetical protein
LLENANGCYSLKPTRVGRRPRVTRGYIIADKLSAAYSLGSYAAHIRLATADMSGKRFVGLSGKQPVPHLLTVIGKKPAAKGMKDTDVDAPPLSSSDSSDNDGLSTRGNITSSHFASSGGNKKSPPRRDIKNAGSNENVTAPEKRFTRNRASARPAAREGAMQA